ncbi:MAG TPA: hypothetical protein VD769_12205 [Gaiellaceae bacterium]|nr:hypothetical protein [Gaiellaceae bacterium]
MGDPDVALHLLIERVQDRLNRQFDDNDALDTKALGVLGADAAAIGVLVAIHESLGALWPAPVGVLAIAGLLLLYVVLPRSLDGGPDWRQFYERFGGSPLLQVELRMLSELMIAVEANDEAAPRKAAVFKVGFAVMAAGLLSVIPVVLAG